MRSAQAYNLGLWTESYSLFRFCSQWKGGVKFALFLAERCSFIAMYSYCHDVVCRLSVYYDKTAEVRIMQLH